MAAQYYVSVNDARTMKDAAHVGTSGTATDIFELRIGDGTYLPSITETILAMKIIERFLIQNGLDQAGANLPAVN